MARKTETKLLYPVGELQFVKGWYDEQSSTVKQFDR